MSGETLDPGLTYEAAEVARLLFHTSLRSFRRNRRKREREGFPRPISRYGKKVWSGAVLIAWRDRQDAAVTGHAAPGVIDFGAVLDSRARAGAR